MAPPAAMTAGLWIYLGLQAWNCALFDPVHNRSVCGTVDYTYLATDYEDKTGFGWVHNATYNLTTLEYTPHDNNTGYPEGWFSGLGEAYLAVEFVDASLVDTAYHDVWNNRWAMWCFEPMFVPESTRPLRAQPPKARPGRRPGRLTHVVEKKIKKRVLRATYQTGE